MLMRGIPWVNSKEFLMAALCSPACWPIAQPLCLLYWKLFPPSTPNYWQLLDWNDCISVTWRLLGSPWIPHSALKITSTLNQAFKWYQLTSSSIVDEFKFLLHPPCVDTAWPQTTYIPFEPGHQWIIWDQMSWAVELYSHTLAKNHKVFASFFRAVSKWL